MDYTGIMQSLFLILICHVIAMHETAGAVVNPQIFHLLHLLQLLQVFFLFRIMEAGRSVTQSC